MKILGLGGIVDGWKLVSIQAAGVKFTKTGEKGESRTLEMSLKDCEIWLTEFPSGTMFV